MIKHAKFCVVHKHVGHYPIEAMCEVLECSRSGYYAWRNRRFREDPDAAIAEAIARCQKKNRGAYGYRRVKLWFNQKEGLVLNHKRVQRIMTKYGLQAEIRRKRRYKAHKERAYKADNIQAQDFEARKRNEKWVTDISYIRTEAGNCYLSAIKDLSDGFIVAHQLGRRNDMGIVAATLKKAKKEAAVGLILHSDQGTQYTSKVYFDLTQKYGIIPSMSRPGTPLDNAPIESFFGTLKTECIYRQRLANFEEADQVINDYVHYYNYIRIRTKDQMTPYERRRSRAGDVQILDQRFKAAYNSA